MTFLEWGVNYCYQRGMFPEQAESVIATVIDQNEAMEGRWNDHIEEYPSLLLATLAMFINRVAIEWIENNCPEAWYKPLFR